MVSLNTTQKSISLRTFRLQNYTSVKIYKHLCINVCWHPLKPLKTIECCDDQRRVLGKAINRVRPRNASLSDSGSLVVFAGFAPGGFGGVPVKGLKSGLQILSNFIA